MSSGFDGTVSLFDGTTGMLLGTVAADTLIVSADFEPDGRTVLVTSNYQGVYRWNTGTEHLVALACAHDLSRSHQSRVGRDLRLAAVRAHVSPERPR